MSVLESQDNNFNLCSLVLNDLYKTVELNSQKVTVFTTITQNSKKETNKLRILLIVDDKMLSNEFDFQSLSDIKRKLGLINGTWKAFFKSIQLALSAQDGGSFSLKEPPKINSKISNINNTQSFNINSQINEDFTGSLLALNLPLSETVKIKCNLEMKEVDQSEQLLLYKECFFRMIFLCDLYKKEKVKEEKIVKSGSENKQKQLENTRVNFIKDKLQKSMDIKKNKRKFKSDLVNPNAKKRSIRGVEFVDNEQSDEGSSN